MIIQQTDIDSRTAQLSPRAFEAFASDIARLLGREVIATDKGASVATLADLKKQFKNLVAVAALQAEGTLAGTFQLLLGQEAFFTIGGLLAAQSEKMILQNRLQGTLQDANDIDEAVGQLANMIVAAWDRVFQSELASHGRFMLNRTFIGNPWNNPDETMGLTSVSELLVVSAEIQIKQYPSIICAVVYPKELFEKRPSDAHDGMAADHDTQRQTVETKTNSNVLQSGPVFESIRKITQSPAVLPGQSSDNILTNVQILHSITAQDIMRKDIVWANPDETVEQALAKMQQYNINYLLVGRDCLLEGIISKSDVRAAMSPYLQEMFAKWRRPLDLASRQIRIRWIMTKHVHTTHPDASLVSLLRLMSAQKIHALPVVDQAGAAQGLITAFEIFNALSSTS